MIWAWWSSWMLLFSLLGCVHVCRREEAVWFEYLFWKPMFKTMFFSPSFSFFFSLSHSLSLNLYLFLPHYYLLPPLVSLTENLPHHMTWNIIPPPSHPHLSLISLREFKNNEILYTLYPCCLSTHQPQPPSSPPNGHTSTHLTTYNSEKDSRLWLQLANLNIHIKPCAYVLYH